MEYQHLCHGFGPVYDARSRVLILGSFPSVKSREANFYYGHAQNRFWPLIARLLEAEPPQSTEEKRALVLSRGIALWDVIEECDIIGSADSSIKNAVPTDIRRILGAADIRGVYCNGALSHKLYMRHLYPVCGLEAVKLPSTSPANAAWSIDRLYTAWRQILEKL